MAQNLSANFEAWNSDFPGIFGIEMEIHSLELYFDTEKVAKVLFIMA